MSEKTDYTPIACSLYDHLEASATLGRRCVLRYREADGRLVGVEDRIVDVFARGGEEFLTTGSGVEIRLDRIESLDGVAFRPGAGC